MGSDYVQRLEQLVAMGAAFSNTTLGRIVLFIGVTVAVAWLLRRNSFVMRAWSAAQDAIFNNWQLGLLGATGIVLSAASGWTTWDGMRNFTGEPILSGMITFGIQGVMLIVAWLIGESFATGMNARTSNPGHRIMPFVSAFVGIAILMWALVRFGGLGSTRQTWTQYVDVLLFGTIGGAVIFWIALNRGSDLVTPYIQSARIIVRNAVLWVMFLACMATSVFFSFDSLFSAIFPKDERARAADLRAQNQVAGLIADIDETVRTRRLQAIDELFANEAWRAYDAQLSQLAAAAQASTREIERFFNDQIEARNRVIKEQQERVATSQSTQAGLASKKTVLLEELTRLKGERGTLAADFTEKQTEFDARTRAVDAKRVEAIAEEKGAEGTLKQGRGPQYRQIMSELAQLQAALKIQEDRVRDAQRRLAGTDQRITQIERELASVDGDLAKLKGEAQTAEQRIRLAETQGAEDPASRIDPARVLPAFEAARAEFRQDPDPAKLTRVQQQCTQVVNAMVSNEVTRGRVRGIDCEPKKAGEAAAILFALDAGAKVFTANCIGGDKLAQHNNADGLFGFARKCLADSSLPSRETDQLRSRINFVELNRDDKAHRFVVTWNAFQDGNRLAYLALAIAIAIDGLIFMSGLFGANAVRSPLSDVPSDKARSAAQLEAIIDTALIPHKFDTARLVLGAMRPMTLSDGYMARIVINDDDPHASDVRRVLNAGATIGAVRHADASEHVYEIRAELFEYLSQVAKREFEQNREHVDLADLERTVSTALLPDIGHNASMVLSYLHPIREQHGFMAEVRLEEVAARARETGTDDDRNLRNALNAGAMYQRVQRAGETSGHFYIHADFYKVLVRLRARMLSAASPRAIAKSVPPRPVEGGRLGGELKAVEQPAAVQRIVDQTLRSDANQQALDAWRRHCQNELYASLGLERQDVVDRLGRPGVERAAMEAANALIELSKWNQPLREYLGAHENRQLTKLGSTSRWLQADASGDQEKEELLESINIEIETQLPALILFPENGLIDGLIEKIEYAASTPEDIRHSERILRDRLKDVVERMREDDLADPRIWEGVADAFRRLTADQARSGNNPRGGGTA
jgi:hypothetical protein